MIPYLVVTSVLVYLVDGQGTSRDQVCLAVPPEVHECFRSFNNKPISQIAGQVSCLQELLWNYVPGRNLTSDDLRVLDGLSKSMRTASGARNGGQTSGPRSRNSLAPPSGFRLRSEYRTLSADQRRRFHDAMNVLYRNGTIQTFARIHANAVSLHHDGASFLPWHRVFLVQFEELLREVDPTVSLPYWDSTMDNDMGNGVNSVLWSAEYLGNGVGSVTSGPFAGWVTDQGNLARDYGRDGLLFRKSDLRNVLAQCRLEDISTPTASFRNDFELLHGGPHTWVGDDMAFGQTAAWDPTFYLHHTFVDYVWEVFRRRQVRDCRVDPTRDYPNVRNDSSHAFGAPMYAFEQFTNGDGLASYWTEDFYGYNQAPVCPQCCERCSRPAPIRCDRRRQVCVARSRRNIPFGASPRSNMTALRDEILDPAEIEALENPPAPRNRGPMFRHPPNDGRTLATAVSDAINALERIRSPVRSFSGPSSRRRWA